ncbi:MAG: adenylate/guanylate cyclase domain-containing protein, partial [Alphaproteobacteria bacterium]|nr:adenylate/guanylate cyclase domain-containing protein [Alphaproteobacteria bacterium]
MAEERVDRRLAAIFAGDIAGYSRLMGADEEGTLRQLKAHRQELVDPKIAEHRGRIVKTTGDGMLVEFVSVVDAVRCAVDIQRGMAERNAGVAAEKRIEFRVGINVGDIIGDANDIYGDGVNVAARLEALADPGGIMVSSNVYEQVRDKLGFGFEDMGEQTVKNIARPVGVHRVTLVESATPITATSAAPAPAEEALALPDKPSIAVLAFSNLSGDPEQEYFCDGVSEDIITELSRFRSLFVIARNSSFSYKGKSPDIRQVGKELGVRYVLEGSIRRAGLRIRVTGQLIDTLTGNHIWADRYDRVLEDIFAVQEELTQSIVRAIMPEIEAAELEKVRRRRPDSLGAHEIAVRAWAKVGEAFIKNDRALRDAAIGEAKAALAIDARSTLALNALAFAQWQRVNLYTASDRETAWQEGMAAATRAIEADRSDSIGYAIKGLLLAYASDRDRIDEALANARQAHALNPHNMRSLNALAFVENMAGNPESAIEHLHEALR